MRQGFLFVPFIGLHSFQDSDSKGLDAGLRAGGLLGKYLNNDWSLNAGVAFDVVNTNSAVTDLDIDLQAQILELTFNPLFHVGNAKVEFVVGPKIGGWVMWTRLAGTSEDGSRVIVNGTSEGWTFGGTVGVFLRATPGVSAGVMTSLETRDLLYSCAKITGMESRCESGGSSTTILGFVFALML